MSKEAVVKCEVDPALHRRYIPIVDKQCRRRLKHFSEQNQARCTFISNCGSVVDVDNISQV